MVLGVNFVNKWNKSEVFGGLLSNFTSVYVNAWSACFTLQNGEVICCREKDFHAHPTLLYWSRSIPSQEYQITMGYSCCRFLPPSIREQTATPQHFSVITCKLGCHETVYQPICRRFWPAVYVQEYWSELAELWKTHEKYDAPSCAHQESWK